MNTCGGGGLQPKILEVKQLGFMDNGTGKHQSNTVYDENALCPNITTIEGGGTQQIKVLTENNVVAIDEQNMNVRTDTFGTLTTDGSSPKHNNRVMTESYRIRKLTPRECGRLMSVTDEDINKILEVNSNSQAYKQFGNSIVVQVMVAMFSNLNIQGIPEWQHHKKIGGGRYAKDVIL